MDTHIKKNGQTVIQWMHTLVISNTYPSNQALTFSFLLTVGKTWPAIKHAVWTSPLYTEITHMHIDTCVTHLVHIIS